MIMDGVYFQIIVVIQLTKKMLNLWLKMVVLANHLLINGLMVKQQLLNGGDNMGTLPELKLNKKKLIDVVNFLNKTGAGI